ncbi:hypothetical protein AXG93_3817s1230 [Marchantia polymorpha subsp. ruderalis]|uniref:Plastid lipid-associated protein/fibrillin conserved domain-containing protein n=1 Tax=Marchantia polymorpha subsp. ruderalis TaxID=1480154 RepID=A0A176W0G1_MARPO|nr:hypothetical protein AXG93_3817s1230 [Marchantia polymorpha subsp. ruderalis]
MAAMAALSATPSTVLASIANTRSGFGVSEAEGRRSNLARTNCKWTTDSRTNSRVDFASSYAPIDSLRCRRRRPSLIRASTAEQQQQQASAAGSAGLAAERTRLKQQLFDQMEAASGNLNEECLATIGELEKINPNPEPLLYPELYVGCWTQLKAGHKGTGRKGEGKAEVGFEGVSMTLGRATFGVFKPADLEIILGEVYNPVEEASPDKESIYSLILLFTTKNPRGDDLPPIESIIVNPARQTVDSATRLGLAFYETSIRPCNPQRDLEAWKEIFQEAGGMDEQTGEIKFSYDDKRAPVGEGFNPKPLHNPGSV